MLKKQIINLTTKLINIESIKEKPDKLDDVLDVIKNDLSNYYCKSFLHNNIKSLLYTNTKNARKFKIILNVHLDVVPGLKEQFVTSIKGDKLYGRGAYDMKASAAVEILIFKNLAKSLNYPIALQLVTDEETGGFNGTKHQIEKGICGDFVIAGESTNFEVNNEAKGIYWLEVTTYGSSAHAARPWEGENAINKMVKLVQNLNKLLPIPTSAKWVTTQNLATIRTDNTANNKVPDKCTATFDIRYIPMDKNIIINKIIKILPSNSEWKLLIKEPSQLTNKNNKYINKLIKSIYEITKVNHGLVSYHGASDIRHYDKIRNAGVCFGPIGAGLHTDNEWVSIKSLVQYYKILEHFLKSL